MSAPSAAALSSAVHLLERGVALGREGEIDQADIGRRHADRRAVELALELGQHLADGAGGAGGGRDHRHRGGAGAALVGVDLVEDLLVVGVGVDRGHQPAGDADAVVHHLGDRRQAIGRARGVGDDRVLGGQLVVIDAVDDRQVDALGGRRDQDFLRAGSKMGAGLVTIREEAGAFQREIDPVGAVGQLAGIALGGDLDPPAVDDQVVAVGADLAGLGAVDRVALEQQRVGFGVGEVVDRDQLEAAVRLLEHGASDEAADPPEAVDRNSGRHSTIS